MVHRSTKSDKDIVKDRIKNGISTPIEKVHDKKDQFWHIIKGHEEMMSKNNIDRIIDSLQHPNEIIKAKDKFGNEANCYILEKSGNNTLITIVRNDIITSYKPTKNYLKKQREEGEIIWKN